MQYSLRIALAIVLLVPSICAQNQSLVLVNGINGSAEAPYNPLLMAPPALTVEAWVTYDGSNLGTLNRFPTIARGSNVPGWSWFLRVNAGSTAIRELRWAVRTQNAGVVLVNWSFNPGDLLCPTHVAATYDGVTSRLLINGVEVGSTAGGGAIVDNGGVIAIGEGRRSGFNEEVWNGTIDDLRIWSTARTAAQISSTLFAPVTSAPNLEASWQFDGDLSDATGNGNNASAFGTIGYVPSTTPAAFEYETNSPEASMDIDGISAGGFCNVTATYLVGTPSVMNIDSSLIGNPFTVLVTAPNLLIPASGGAISTANGQVLNLDLSSPALLFLFGGPISNPFTATFPGAVAVPLAAPSAITAAAQMAIVDPSNPDGLSLSAGVEYNVTSCPTSANFDALAVGVGNLPLGWSDGGGTAMWSVGSGTTSSVGTGPLTGAFSPANYLYAETSGAGGTATFIADTCAYDVSALTTFSVDFRLSRLGATMGTLNVLQDDGTGTFPTVIASYTGAEPTGMDWTAESVPLAGPLGATVRIRFEYTGGGGFTGDLALDDVILP